MFKSKVENQSEEWFAIQTRWSPHAEKLGRQDANVVARIIFSQTPDDGNPLIGEYISNEWDKEFGETREWALDDQHPTRDAYWTGFWIRFDELAEVI